MDYIEIKVPALEQTTRLDKFLIEKFPDSSRTYWRIHLTADVLVNGSNAQKGMVLHGGEKITLKKIPSNKLPALKPNPKIKLEILYEDKDILVINKPTGMPCYPLEENETETVINGMIAQFPAMVHAFPLSLTLSPKGRGNYELGLINRLDNETSGILLFAKNPKAKSIFQKLNQSGNITKTYLAWVQGKIDSHGVIKTPIAHHHKNKSKMILPKDEKEAHKLKARPALTQYKILEKQRERTLLQVKIFKGQRHQIRIHLASIGHPILGDQLYGSHASQLNRHLLHAAEVAFRHPISKKTLKIIAQAPQNFSPINSD